MLCLEVHFSNNFRAYYPVLAQTQQHYPQHGTSGGTAVYPQPLQQQKQLNVTATFSMDKSTDIKEL
ncbi:hypothetical protein QOT17_011829 [Balamuthia mandrillaris]